MDDEAGAFPGTEGFVPNIEEEKDGVTGFSFFDSFS